MFSEERPMQVSGCYFVMLDEFVLENYTEKSWKVRRFVLTFTCTRIVIYTQDTALNLAQIIPMLLSMACYER